MQTILKLALEAYLCISAELLAGNSYAQSVLLKFDALAPGQPNFAPSSNTPVDINNLVTSSRLFNNPNLVKPFRLDRSEAITNDNNHTYTVEQKKYDAGRVDRFVEENKFIPNYLAPFRCPSIEPIHQNPRVCFNPTAYGISCQIKPSLYAIP